MSRANTRELVGSAAVVEGDFPRLMLCDKLYAFSLDESRADSRFVAAVLGSRRWRDLIELEATGARKPPVHPTEFISPAAVPRSSGATTSKSEAKMLAS